MIKRINFTYKKLTKNVKVPNNLELIEDRKRHVFCSTQLAPNSLAR